MTFFGLICGQDLENRAAHLLQEFPYPYPFQTGSLKNDVIITVQPENNVLRLERQQKRFLKTQFEFAYFYFSVLSFSFIWN